MAAQRCPRAFINHPKPANHPAIGQAFLVGGIDLPRVVRVLGPLPTPALRPTGWGRSQIMPAQPALDGSWSDCTTWNDRAKLCVAIESIPNEICPFWLLGLARNGTNVCLRCFMATPLKSRTLLGKVYHSKAA